MDRNRTCQRLLHLSTVLKTVEPTRRSFTSVLKTSYIKKIILNRIKVINNFQIEFKRLKADRGLSNKQIASFTGVKVKDVKQWEAGISLPTDKKIINALEGLLGTEITHTLDGFSTEQFKDEGSLLTEESLFSIKNEDVQIKQTKIDKLRNTFQRKETTLNDYDYEPIEASEVKEETPKEYLTKPVSYTHLRAHET